MSEIRENHKKSIWTRVIIRYRTSVRPNLNEFQVPLMVAVFIGVFMLGYLGFSTLYPHELFLNKIYLTMQLFVINSGVYQGPPILLLDIARIVAPVFLYVSLLVLVAHRFYYHLELVWMQLFTRNHVVVCGLGYVGSIVTRNSLSARSVTLVAIERDPFHNEIEWCRSHGIPVVTGDATDKKILEQACVSSAQDLYIATGNDEVNAKIIAQVSELVRDRTIPLKCHVHIVDPNFTNLLHAPQVSVQSASGLDIKFLNLYQIASFWYAEKLPDLLPLSLGTSGAHFLVVGVGRMGESLIFELAKRSQQQYFGGKPHERIRITIIDREAARKKALLESRYARLSEYCEIIAFDMELFSPEFYQRRYLEGTGCSHPLNAVYICTADESLNFSTGLYLNQKLKDCTIPIIMRTAYETGFAHFFNEIAGKQTDDYKNLRAFPLVSFSSFIDSAADMNELIARTLHRNYVFMRLDEDGARPGSEASLMPWDSLNEDFKEANRDQAAHIECAVNAVGYSIISRASWDEPLTVFSEEETEQMSITEHQRWWNNRADNGWTFGPKKDTEKKISPYLVPWDHLDEKIKDYDRKFVRSYPRILAMLDLTLKKNS